MWPIKAPKLATVSLTCDAAACSRFRELSMDLPLIIQPIEKYTVVEFRTPSLMDPIQLENISTAIYRLVDVEDHRQIVLDFEKVQYLSSQALGILMALRKKLEKLPHSSLVLCGVGPKLMELIKITRLDKLLTIKPSQKEAVKVLIP
jgi:anti-sigma B factor antagonist